MSVNIDIRDAKYFPQEIGQVWTERIFPTVLMWNRLEGRPRRQDFDKALKAEVRDALWMLTRQWQMGEFKGDDAGSPVFAKIHITTSELDTYKAAGNAEQSFEVNVPLETKAEQKKIPFTRNGINISIDIRLQMGRYWLKLLKQKALDYSIQYTATYKFELPGNSRDTDYIYAHKNIWQQYAAISGRSLDGYKLYEYITGTGHTASDGIINTDPDKTELDNLGIQFIDWYKKMYYQPADEQNNAWLPEKLEYQFECNSTAGGEEKNIRAEEYYHGHLDWYAFDISTKASANTESKKTAFTSAFIPSHVEFDGMPNTRWWKFEDGKTSFGNVQPSTTDISQLLLMEFGLVFANDWFVVPFKLPIGSLANVEGLVVKNNFGENLWIEPSEEAGADNTTWSMFKLSSDAQNNTLLLAPSAMKVDEGEELEEIVLIRDEISNMVWGIETQVPTPIGVGVKGREAALQTRLFHEKIVRLQTLKSNCDFYIALIIAMPNLATGPIETKSDIEEEIFNLIKDLPDVANIITDLSGRLVALKENFEEITEALNKENPDINFLQRELNSEIANMYNIIKTVITNVYENIPDKTPLEAAIIFFERKQINGFAAPVSYLAMTDVPENWIPFVPVHVEGSNREIILQRASMLRIINGDTELPKKVKPLTSILRQGIEDQPKPSPYYINEEEVPRAGVKVSQAFQRTRWTSGEVYVWLGMQKKTGRGEGHSGLAFDQLIDVRQ